MANISTIKQELKDFKEEVVNRLIRIESQTTKTNGKIADAMTDIALGVQERKQMIAVCKANHPERRQYTMAIVGTISGLASALMIILINHFIFK